MRIALCLSGQPRTWRATRDSLRAFFSGHRLDLFLHTWRDEDPAELQAVVEAYAPRAVHIEERPLFVDAKRRLAERFPARPPLSMFDMFHSIAGSLALAFESGEAYDLVVRARFDALFAGHWTEEEPAEKSVLVPDIYPDLSGCTDQFAIGRPHDMRLYGGAGAWLQQGVDQLGGDQWLRPEQVLRHYLEQVCGLRVELRPIAMKLLRAEQADRPFAEVVDDPLFHAAKHEAWEAFASERFPELAVDFGHYGRTALALERAVGAWLEARAPMDGRRLLQAPWPSRLEAIDAFIGEQAGAVRSLDEAGYRTVRLICAALLQRMEPDRPMPLESWVVHVLSANPADMQLARHWALEDPGRLDALSTLLQGLGPIAQALTFANPLDQAGIGGWRPRPLKPLQEV